MARDKDVSRRIIKYFRENANLAIHYKDVAEAIGIGVSSANSTLGHVTQRYPNLGIRRVASGMYMYVSGSEATLDPNPEPPKEAPMVYEEVGVTESGRVVIRDEKGVLYSREPL